MAVKPVPDGYHTITPYLTVGGAGKLIEFLQEAFSAQVMSRMTGPNGAVSHAEVKIGDSMVMIGEARDEWQPTPCSLYLYVKDADALYQQAMAAGAVSLMEPADMFYGDRNAGVKDPSGNMWWIATHIEDVPHEEIQRRSLARMEA